MGNRSIVALACSGCKQRNYSKTRNKKVNLRKLETKKYCPFCRQHKVHKETKSS